MGRRIVDEETAAIATERLARLLGELAPRRALERPAETSDDPLTAGVPPSVLPTERLPGRIARVVEPGGPVEEEQAASRVGDAPRGRQLGAFGRRHLGVIAVLPVIGVAGAGWALLRARPIALAAPISLTTTKPGGAATDGPTRGSASASAGPVGTSAAASGQAPSAARILVHVVGAVRRPGVVTLPDRARVQDAIRAAGGLTSTARPGEPNLAQVLTDGEQIVIGSCRDPGGEVRDGTTSSGSGAATGSASGGAGSSASGATGAVVDLNAATPVQLDTLPGVGPVTAQRIVAWRTEHGRFSRVEELQEVDGIGPKTYAQIAPHVRV